MTGTYTAAEAAERLGVSARTVRRQVAAGVLPRLPLAGRILRIPAKVVDAMADGDQLEDVAS